MRNGSYMRVTYFCACECVADAECKAHDQTAPARAVREGLTRTSGAIPPHRRRHESKLAAEAAARVAREQMQSQAPPVGGREVRVPQLRQEARGFVTGK